MADPTFKTADLYAYLAANVGLSALVSTRIYPINAPTSATMPYIIYQRLNNRSMWHLGSTSSSKLTVESFQFDIFSSTALSCENVSIKLRQALDGYSGLMNGGTNVRRVFLQDVLDSFENPTDATENFIHRIMMTFDFWVIRDVPTY